MDLGEQTKLQPRAIWRPVAGRLGRSFTYSAQLQRLVLPEGQEARLRQAISYMNELCK